MSNIRVSPSFSTDNDKEAYVGELLQKLERTKSRFITDAVLFFLVNNKNIDIQVSKKNKEDVSIFIDQLSVFIGNEQLDMYKMDNTLVENIHSNKESKKVDHNNESNISSMVAYNENITNEDIDMFLDGLEGFL